MQKSPERGSLTPFPDISQIWQLLQVHRPALALTLAEQLLAHAPMALPPQLARIEALRQLQRLPEAAEAAKAAIGSAPESASAFAAYARVVGQQGQLAKAEMLITQAIQLNPVSAEYYGFAAQLLLLQQRTQEAVACAAAGLRLDAGHADCLLWRALAQERLDQPGAADEDFARVLRAAPASALVHAQRGLQLLERYEPRQAAAHLAEALRLDPTRREVIPALQNARRQQLWPAWLLQLQQKRRLDWSNGFPFSWRGPAAGLLTPYFQLRSRWHTRHDPFFRERIPGQRAAVLRRWLVIGGLVLFIPGFLYAFITFELPPFTLVIFFTALIRAFMEKQRAD
ncbi:hypothetical protein [Hymenobacter convexus]|uniref:hypothetical protein n=1 Tax=Hymenobacter sp. CA1UV-4 TaxID=3063782 RepID=UPI0027137D47|nr:hypothetical protein [Hymenobacter sp. CA1UV-4]MDO7853259.1 hypothetical protein [Hymenobacter sp. CA1UV-4]